MRQHNSFYPNELRCLALRNIMYQELGKYFNVPARVIGEDMSSVPDHKFFQVYAMLARRYGLREWRYWE